MVCCGNSFCTLVQVAIPCCCLCSDNNKCIRCMYIQARRCCLSCLPSKRGYRSNCGSGNGISDGSTVPEISLHSGSVDLSQSNVEIYAAASSRVIDFTFILLLEHLCFTQRVVLTAMFGVGCGVILSHLKPVTTICPV